MTNKKKDTDTQQRLIWLLDPSSGTLDVALQHRQEDTAWDYGKNISLATLYEQQSHLSYVSKADQRVINTLEKIPRPGDPKHFLYAWDPEKSLLALLEHPHIALSDQRTTFFSLIRGIPIVHITQTALCFTLRLTPFLSKKTFLIEPHSPHCYALYVLDDALAKLQRHMTAAGLEVPSKDKALLDQFIQALPKHIATHSTIDNFNPQVITADPTPIVQLFPLDTGLNVSVWVKPFGKIGLYYKPQRGPTVIALQTTKKIKTVHRNFKEEEKAFNDLLTTCPQLEDLSAKRLDLSLTDTHACLRLLETLQQRQIKVEWPRGQALKIKKVVESQDLKLQLQSKGYGFLMLGQLTVADDQSLTLETLLECLEDSPFIEINSHEFIKLSDYFYKQLQRLKAAIFTDTVIHLHAAALATLDLAPSLDQASRTLWKEKQKAYCTPVEAFAIPKELTATLRPYQKTGMQWLLQRTHANLGVCLADEMGLGKTLQAIGLLLHHAKQGPSLVIAPSSICFNWMNELQRFAPTLNALTLSSSSELAVLKQVQKKSVLICSYHLLPKLLESLLNIQWGTLILDEAHAIKNPFAKRTQAVKQLPAKIKCILTGTPIENHLRELWSLFDFLNPGLLGTLADFLKRFNGTTPQVQHQIQHGLKPLIAPFWLRRTKKQVLPDLPAYYEQNLMITLSTAELEFYQSLCQHALNQLQQNIESTAGQRRIHILAELTRLRQACCDPSLVDPALDISSSKLSQLLFIVRELHENKESMLIYSQFVQVLKRVANDLQKADIPFQYMDGSTPQKDRKKRIDAFQQGESSAFLISLKAGGMGLNLTQANYVLLLDPWWNPAVEAQAASRAHRLGQQRAVTTYRFITRNTIEEKILALHAHKQALADELLADTHQASALDEATLLSLFQ